MRRYSNVVGVDDAPFDRGGPADVPIVGAVLAGTRLDGIVTGRVARDGDDGASALAAMVRGSPFYEHVQLVMTNGITLAGFNVLDLAALHASVARPVLVVARREPDLAAIRAALGKVRGGDAKWRLIESAGPMEPCESLWIQREGLSLEEAAASIRATRLQGNLPEPVRLAHLIAGAIGDGTSRGRA